MGNEVEMLNSIRKTTQMGCYGIENVLDETVNRKFRTALRDQYKEYGEIYEEAERLLSQHNGKSKNVNPIVRYGTAMSSIMRVRSSPDPTAKIAEMMLQGNTRGMIKSMHNIRTMGMMEPRVAALSRRLLQTEQANIDQMKSFL